MPAPGVFAKRPYGRRNIGCFRQTFKYSVYKRNSSDSMYNVDNITEFFLGEDDVLYVIFAYGNQNQTNEMDIVVM